MARPRQPTALLAAKGSYERHPERASARADEPAGYADLPPAPEHLPDAMHQTWEELRCLMHPRVCNVPDVVPFEQLVRLVYKMRTAFDDMTGAQLSQLTRMYTEFGMTPASRSKVHQAPESKPADPWDEFKH